MTPYNNTTTFSTILYIISATSTAALGQVLSDDFNDNALDTSLWCASELAPSLISIDEVNGHIEFASPGISSSDAKAYIYNCGWALDATSDFKWRADFHYFAPLGPINGDTSLAVVCWFDGEPDSPLVPRVTGVIASAGIDTFGSYLGSEYVLDGTTITEDYDALLLNDGTVYYSYHSGTDILTVSVQAYDHPNAAVYSGIRAASGKTTANVAFAGSTQGTIPGFSGNSSWVDNFVIDQGVLTFPCPADIFDDGMLNFFDVSEFLIAFGNQDPIADFFPDGLYNFFDVSEFLIAYGAGCP